MTSGKCMWHSGIQTMVANAQKDATEAKTDIKNMLEAIRSKASTATILVVCGLIISALGIVAKIWYDAYQTRMARLESTDAVLQTRMDEHYATIEKRLDNISKALMDRKK